MQLDTFFMNLIQISLFDGLVIGLSAAFIFTTFCALILAKRRASSIIRSIIGIIIVIVGTLVGLAAMNTAGIIALWSGSGIHSLIGTDLETWNELVTSTFIIYQNYALALSSIGSLVGLGIGYSIGISPKDETTPFGIAFAILGLCALGLGFTLALLPLLLVRPVSELYILSIAIAILLIFHSIYRSKKRMHQESDSYGTEIEFSPEGSITT